MKLIVALFAIVLVSCVVAEDCPNNNIATDCTHMACEHDFHKECLRGTCTCTVNDFQCTTQASCTTWATQNSKTCTRSSGWHCIDGNCRCGGFFGGVGRK